MVYTFSHYHLPRTLADDSDNDTFVARYVKVIPVKKYLILGRKLPKFGL